MNLPELRIALVDARAELRAVEHEHKVVRATVEQSIIERMNGSLGKNAEERERNLLVALAENDVYRSHVYLLQDAKHQVELYEAHVANEEDLRDELRRLTREHFATAILHQSATQRRVFGIEEDATADSTIDVEGELAERQNRAMRQAAEQGLLDYTA